MQNHFATICTSINPVLFSDILASHAKASVIFEEAWDIHPVICLESDLGAFSFLAGGFAPGTSGIAPPPPDALQGGGTMLVIFGSTAAFLIGAVK